MTWLDWFNVAQTVAGLCAGWRVHAWWRNRRRAPLTVTADDGVVLQPGPGLTDRHRRGVAAGYCHCNDCRRQRAEERERGKPPPKPVHPLAAMDAQGRPLYAEWDAKADAAIARYYANAAAPTKVIAWGGGVVRTIPDGGTEEWTN